MKPLSINIILLLVTLWVSQEAQAGSACPQGDTNCVLTIVDAKLDKLKRDIMKDQGATIKTIVAQQIKELKDELVAEAKKAGGEKGGRKEFVLTSEQIGRIVEAVLKKLPPPTAGVIVEEKMIEKVANPLIKRAVTEAVKEAVTDEVAAQMPTTEEPAKKAEPVPTTVAPTAAQPNATFGLETLIVPKNGVFLIVQVGREGSCLRGMCVIAAGAGWSPDKDFALSTTASQLWGGEMFKFGLSASVTYDTGVLRGSPLVTFGAGPAVSWTPTEWLGLRSSLLLGMVGRRDPATDRSDTGFRVTIPIAASLRF